MAHAIERLLATPNTTAVLPFKSSNMNGSSRKRKRISAFRVARTLLSAAFDIDYEVGSGTHGREQSQDQHQRQRGMTGMSAPHLVCGCGRSLLRFDWPARAAEGDRIHGCDHAETGRQAYARSNCSYGQA